MKIEVNQLHKQLLNCSRTIFKLNTVLLVFKKKTFINFGSFISLRKFKSVLKLKIFYNNHVYIGNHVVFLTLHISHSLYGHITEINPVAVRLSCSLTVTQHLIAPPCRYTISWKVHLPRSYINPLKYFTITVLTNSIINLLLHKMFCVVQLLKSSLCTYNFFCKITIILCKWGRKLPIFSFHVVEKLTHPTVKNKTRSLN